MRAVFVCTAVSPGLKPRVRSPSRGRMATCPFERDRADRRYHTVSGLAIHTRRRRDNYRLFTLGTDRGFRAFPQVRSKQILRLNFQDTW
jgi:hypothetical protein